MWIKAAAPAFVILVTAGFLNPAGTVVAASTISKTRALELERLVLNDCGACHGMTLEGGLGPDLRSAALSKSSVSAIATIIEEGIPDTAMPPWKPLLSREEAEWIAAYLLKGGRQ